MGRASMAEIYNGINKYVKDSGTDIDGLRRSKRELSTQYNSDQFDPAFQAIQSEMSSKLGRTKTSLSMADAIQALMVVPSITPAMAGDMLIEKGADPEDVKMALQTADMDTLDDIDGKADSQISPFLQDQGQAFDQNKGTAGDIDPEVMEDLIAFLQRNPHSADDMSIEKYLEQHGLESTQCRAIIRMIHMTEDNLRTSAADKSGGNPHRCPGCGSFHTTNPGVPTLCYNCNWRQSQENQRAQEALPPIKKNIFGRPKKVQIPDTIPGDWLKGASIKTGFDVNDLVGVFQDLDAQPAQTMSGLTDVGVDPRLIHNALQRPPGQLNDRPNMQATPSPNMSEGQTGLVGPTEDPFASPEGPMAPSGNNYIGQGGEGGQGTAGGDSDPLGAGDITSPQSMNELNEQVRNPSEPDAKGIALGENEHNRDVVEKLEQKGVPPQVKQEILQQLGIDQRNKSNNRILTSKESIMRTNESEDSGIREGSTVSYKGENYKVAATSSTLYGDMIVLSSGQQVFVDDDDLGAQLQEKKESSTEETYQNLMQKAAKFRDKTYYYEEDDLRKMAKKAEKLIEKLHAYEPTKFSESVGIREQISLLHTAAKVFEEAAVKQSQETQDYLDSQPKYHVGMVSEGYEFGPGGGDAIVITADTLDQEHDDLLESWPKTAATVASVLIEENLEVVGSAGDMRRIASRYIDSNFAHLDGETQDQIRTDFLATVEKGRRIAQRDLPKKEAKVDQPLPHDYDEGVFY